MSDRDRLRDLQVLRALEGLDPDERRELGELLSRHPEEDDDSLEIAAAAIQLATMPAELPPLSAGLRERLEADAARFVEARARERRPAAPGPAETRTLAASPWPGWLVAAAAALALVVTWSRPGRRPAGPDPESGRGALLAASDTLQLGWTATEDPAAGGAAGEVVWNNREQLGFMRFRGLPINDASRSQYQLWIVDARRPDSAPIDGGVFDVTGAEAVVPIDAKLEVFEPGAFVVTLEQPGGVVVSAQEHVLLVASVE